MTTLLFVAVLRAGIRPLTDPLLSRIQTLSPLCADLTRLALSEALVEISTDLVLLMRSVITNCLPI